MHTEVSEGSEHTHTPPPYSYSLHIHPVNNTLASRKPQSHQNKTIIIIKPTLFHPVVLLNDILIHIADFSELGT